MYTVAWIKAAETAQSYRVHKWNAFKDPKIPFNQPGFFKVLEAELAAIYRELTQKQSDIQIASEIYTIIDLFIVRWFLNKNVPVILHVPGNVGSSAFYRYNPHAFKLLRELLPACQIYTHQPFTGNFLEILRAQQKIIKALCKTSNYRILLVRDKRDLQKQDVYVYNTLVQDHVRLYIDNQNAIKQTR